MPRRKKPEVDWRDIVRADVAALPRSSGGDEMTVTVMAPPSTMSLLRQAARARRMSVSSYVRRSAYAMACHDLQIPFAEVLARDPRVARETNLGVLDPDGTAFGRWEIDRLVGEEGS